MKICEQLEYSHRCSGHSSHKDVCCTFCFIDRSWSHLSLPKLLFQLISVSANHNDLWRLVLVRVRLDGVDKTLDSVFDSELRQLRGSYTISFVIKFDYLNFVELVGEANDTQGRGNTRTNSGSSS